MNRNRIIIKCVLSCALTMFAFKAQLKAQAAKNEKSTLSSVASPLGKKGPATTFTGDVWVGLLVENDPTFNCVLGQVTFSPGARSFWHSHPGGQILWITDGVGYYQEKGQPVRIMRKGDVIKCAPGIQHWHGASADSWLIHAALTPNMEKGDVDWLHQVSQIEYLSIKQNK